MSLTVYPDYTQGVTSFPMPGGETDPLAGLTFAARWQTHNGDNVPLGLWQDIAMTIPAVAEFDPVAVWEDVLSGSGETATQANPDYQPYLVFVSGVPLLEGDGVDDHLDHSVALGDVSHTFVAVGKTLSAQTSYCSIVQAWADLTTVYGGIWSSVASSNGAWGIGGISGDCTAGTQSNADYLVVMSERVGTTCKLFEAGVQVATQTGTFYGGDGGGRTAIGAASTVPSEVSNFHLGAVMIRASQSDGERATIESRMATIFSPIL